MTFDLLQSLHTVSTTTHTHNADGSDPGQNETHVYKNRHVTI